MAPTHDKGQGQTVTEAAKVGLQVSWTKTKVMHMGEGPDPAPLQFGNDIVEFVNVFVYPGSTATNNRYLKLEINRRWGLAASALQPL